MCSIEVRSDKAIMLKHADLIIWDEKVMCMHHNIESVDRTIKHLMHSNIAFGGTAMLFSGDFWQMLLVVQCGSWARTVASCFQRSPIFLFLTVLRLSTNMYLVALQQDPNAHEEVLAFPKILLNVGNGSHLQTEDCKIRHPSAINRKDAIHEMCGANFLSLSKTIKTMSGWYWEQL